MEFERKITEIGGSLFLIIPVDLIKYLDLSAGDLMVMQPEKGKKGTYLSVWKKAEQDKK